MTIPDTHSIGWTGLSFILFDDEAGESGPANTCVLTFSVASENNANASAVIVGTLDESWLPQITDRFERKGPCVSQRFG